MRFAILFVWAASTLAAQTIEVKSLYQPAPLAGVWKYRIADDPRFAAPDFDDSSWADLPMPGPGHPPEKGAVWYRFRVNLPEPLPAEPLSILIGPIGHAYDVFVNGARVGTFGNPRVSGGWGQMNAGWAAFTLPQQSHLTVAIRSWNEARATGSSLVNFTENSWIATTGALTGKLRELEFGRLRNNLSLLLMMSATCLAAVFFLIMPLWRTDASEYFWCGLVLLLACALRLNQATPWMAGTQPLPYITGAIFALALPYIVAWERLFRTLFGFPLSKPVRILFWILTVSTVVLGCLSLVHWPWVGPLFSSYAVLLLFVLGGVYLDLARRGTRAVETPLMNVAVGLYIGANVVFYGLQILRWTGFAPFQQGEAIQQSASEVRAFGLLLFAFAMAVLLNRRSARLAAEQQRLQQELSAAAEIQAMLVPSQSTPAPGLATDTAYLPASEVGGDFHYARRDGDSLIVVIGDVSGKGLRAAMLVSVAIGILRSEKSKAPAAILADLNHGLTGHTGGGFVTGCCARFDPDGTVTIANAGHPAPYCDGREMDVDAELPLGVVTEIAYRESTHTGEQFTFLSDGVLEASNGELYGFDRAREISGQSANEIAEAAKAWGQNDDITVVTVRRTA